MIDDKTLELAEREWGLMRDERDFWREECRKRVEFLAEDQFQALDPYKGSYYCVECGGYGVHVDSCRLARLVAMPTPPEAESSADSARIRRTDTSYMSAFHRARMEAGLSIGEAARASGLTTVRISEADRGGWSALTTLEKALCQDAFKRVQAAKPEGGAE